MSTNVQCYSNSFLQQIHSIYWTSTCHAAFRAPELQVSHRQNDLKLLVLSIVKECPHIVTETFFQLPITHHSLFSFDHLFKLCQNSIPLRKPTSLYQSIAVHARYHFYFFLYIPYHGPWREEAHSFH